MITYRVLLGLCLTLAFWGVALLFGARQSQRIGASTTLPDLLSPRLVDVCDPCSDGDIRGLDASVDGQTVIFESEGNRFIATDQAAQADQNSLPDIFVWREGVVRLASLDAANKGGDHASDRAALSGNGRYLYFRSRAGNWFAEATRAHINLYLKDLATGQLALVSRTIDGAPLNALIVNDHFTQLDSDFSGRYAVFASAASNLVEGVTDSNQTQDVFLIDVDPDGNGDYFDTSPQIHLLSVAAAGNVAGNGVSFEPTISQDGRAVVWLTRATDLAEGLASNGATVDVILMRFGMLVNGSPDLKTRTVVAINRTEDQTEDQVGQEVTLTPQGARMARVAPWRDEVAFVTADDIAGTGDNHAGQDVYVSVGNGIEGADRHLVWMSHAVQTSEPNALSVAWDPRVPPAAQSQVAWVGQSSPRTVDDLLVQRDAPFVPAGWSTVNWLDAMTPSSAPVTLGTLSADGRFAFWVVAESYGFDVPDASANLFRRKIGPDQSLPLTVNGAGGSVRYTPLGVDAGDTRWYSATTVVTLAPQAEVGYRFGEWVGVDARQGVTATVILYTARTVTATFVAMTPPVAANVAVTVAEDARLENILLAISDPDPEESHTIILVQPPTHGTATVIHPTISYQPAPNFSGEDLFTLQVTDAYGLQLAQPAQVTVQVTPVNDAPVAARAEGSGVNDGTPIPLIITVDDPDENDIHTFALESQPTAGSVRVGTQIQAIAPLEYLPNANFVGVDSFTFRATDRANASIVGTATVTVTLPPAPSTPAVPDGTLLLPALRRSP